MQTRILWHSRLRCSSRNHAWQIGWGNITVFFKDGGGGGRKERAKLSGSQGFVGFKTFTDAIITGLLILCAGAISHN